MFQSPTGRHRQWGRCAHVLSPPDRWRAGVGDRGRQAGRGPPTPLALQGLPRVLHGTSYLGGPGSKQAKGLPVAVGGSSAAQAASPHRFPLVQCPPKYVMARGPSGLPVAVGGGGSSAAHRQPPPTDSPGFSARETARVVACQWPALARGGTSMSPPHGARRWFSARDGSLHTHTHAVACPAASHRGWSRAPLVGR